MTSQLVIFRAFLFIFFIPPTLKQLIKTFWPLQYDKVIFGSILQKIPVLSGHSIKDKTKV